MPNSADSRKPSSTLSTELWSAKAMARSPFCRAISKISPGECWPSEEALVWMCRSITD